MTQVRLSLQGDGSRDNFDELGGNSGLAGLVVLDGERGEHLLGVLGGVLHSLHAGGLLAAPVLKHSPVNRRGEVELLPIRRHKHKFIFS